MLSGNVTTFVLSGYRNVHSASAAKFLSCAANFLQAASNKSCADAYVGTSECAVQYVSDRRISLQLKSMRPM